VPVKISEPKLKGFLAAQPVLKLQIDAMQQAVRDIDRSKLSKARP
jgi:hypothetical protein